MLKALGAMIVVIPAGLLAGSQSATAHHSFALFDTNTTISIEGTVKKFDWTNPHSWITLEVSGPERNVSEWMIQLPSASTLARERWNKNYVKVGDKLIMRVNPLKDGRKGGMLASFSPAPTAP